MAMVSETRQIFTAVDCCGSGCGSALLVCLSLQRHPTSHTQLMEASGRTALFPLRGESWGILYLKWKGERYVRCHTTTIISHPITHLLRVSPAQESMYIKQYVCIYVKATPIHTPAWRLCTAVCVDQKSKYINRGRCEHLCAQDVLLTTNNTRTHPGHGDQQRTKTDTEQPDNQNQKGN